MDIGLRVRGHYRKDGPNSPFSGRGLSVQGGSLSIIVSLWRFRCYLIIGTSSLISGKLVNNRLSIMLLLFGYALSGRLGAMERWF